MNTYLAFIDEAGQYKRKRDERFIIRFPYYVKSCLLMPASKWNTLSDLHNQLCENYSIGHMNELKWNHLWKLRRRDLKGKTISYSPDEKFLRNVSFTDAEKYVKDSLANLESYDPVVICTITPNCVFHDRVDELVLEKMHLQDVMQRIEMQMQNCGGLAKVFSDQPASHEHEKVLKEAYHQTFRSGDFIKKYSHIMDTISFDLSHHNCGLQVADFIAGAINGFLRGYRFSERQFVLRIYSKLRKKDGIVPFGYGIIDVPKRPASRYHLIEKINLVLNTLEIG